MQIAKRSMNWVQRKNAFDYVTGQNAKRRLSNQSFIAGQNALAATITNATTSYTNGIAEITARAALARVQKTA
ncbi:hypothetical protein [Devosia sp.]|uniref:hypothetical protein n=1 Tax=Devosia sp. TaxID=1871048 RepID=UPI003A8D8C29